MAATKKSSPEIKLPSAHDWRTSDSDEINKRRFRAREESFDITNTDTRHPIFSTFRIKSRSGLTYAVEVRDLRQRLCACDCVDFRINGLGTCKHIEAVLLHLEARFRNLFGTARKNGSSRVEVVVDAATDSLRVLNGIDSLPRVVQKWFDAEGILQSSATSVETLVAALEQLRQADLPQLRISQEVESWLENRRRAAERRQLRHEYELKVQSGEWPAHETSVPLFPYQREGL